MSGKYWWALHTCKTCFELFPYKCSFFLKLPLIRICVCQWSLTFNCCGMAGIPGDKDGEDSFFFLQRSLWKESGFYLTSDVLGPTLEVLRWMFMTPWMLAGKEILHTRGWRGCHCWQKRLHQHMESSLHLPTMSNTGTQCVPLPHHPLVPPPTSGLPSTTVPCKASACFLPFPKMLSCNSPSRCETVGTLRSLGGNN